MSTGKIAFLIAKTDILSLLLTPLYLLVAVLRIVKQLLSVLLESPGFIAGLLAIMGGINGVYMLLSALTTGKYTLGDVIEGVLGFVLLAFILFWVLTFFGTFIVGAFVAALSLFSIDWLLIYCFVWFSSVDKLMFSPQFHALPLWLRRLLLAPAYLAAYINALVDGVFRVMQYAVYPLLAVPPTLWLIREFFREILGQSSVVETILSAVVMIGCAGVCITVASVFSGCFAAERFYFLDTFGELIDNIREYLRFLCSGRKSGEEARAKQGYSEEAERAQAAKDIGHSMFAGVQNQAELKKRFRELIKQYHPDTHPDMPDTNAKTAQIIEEYRRFQSCFPT